MNFDISDLLNHWEYQAGQIVVRRFKGKDGKEKIQLRVDLGLLQMDAFGRPDGKKPFGHETLFEHYKARLAKYKKENEESEEGFKERPKVAKQFFREGKANQWKQVLTRSQIRRIVTAHQVQMRRFGYLPELS